MSRITQKNETYPKDTIKTRLLPSHQHPSDRIIPVVNQHSRVVQLEEVPHRSAHRHTTRQVIQDSINQRRAGELYIAHSSNTCYYQWPARNGNQSPGYPPPPQQYHHQAQQQPLFIIIPASKSKPRVLPASNYQQNPYPLNVLHRRSSGMRTRPGRRSQKVKSMKVTQPVKLGYLLPGQRPANSESMSLLTSNVERHQKSPSHNRTEWKDTTRSP